MPAQDVTGNDANKPLIGIGSCLAGNAVRYNGQTKAPNQHVRALCETFNARAFCPEMGIGLGVPRPPIHLVGSESSVRLVDVETHTQDHTEAVRDYARNVLRQAPELSGYILVKASPSCGYDRVKRFNEKGNLAAYDQRGIFAAALAEFDPLLPLEDDGRLNDPSLRESFVSRVYTYHQWQLLLSEGLTAAGLVAFYSRYKYLAMAHHVPSYKSLGRMVANAGKEDLNQLGDQFISTLMAALTQRATRRSHSNVLFHLAGYLKRQLGPAERQRLSELIDQYRTGLVPLVVPVTMLKHHFANNPNAYIEQQTFLSPYPDELKLRNLV
ncbi:DUF1722 domain-containing protein [Pseudohalioglobus sediminis]|uniref:DUF1722 domain-containing protein n=1 Tax=Pseudohalioglobus sediminis TaxID=2606449 RepID=A0A5B0WN14_9GAMM|nr:DUF523 and DUF1722 domain-containing protein [Pseudohalioglobus sediminis]KAA1188216.1 DUF1722 domain-containing protein [Pseudohalioglobus sediminis]